MMPLASEITLCSCSVQLSTQINSHVMREHHMTSQQMKIAMLQEWAPLHIALAMLSASRAIAGRPAASKACMLRCAAEHSAPTVALPPRSSARFEAVQWYR